MIVYLLWTFCFAFLHFHFHLVFGGYIETVTISGCETSRLMLTCRHLHTIIAIIDVDYQIVNDSQLNNDSTNNGYISPFPLVHPREALNRRCSGVNHCSFIMTEDAPEAVQTTKGNLTITYACFTDDKIKKYCNSDIVLPNVGNFKGISQGFIHNPGYPRFYSGQLVCKWRISAPAHQKIEITILDISLIVDNVEDDEDCTDILHIKNSGGNIIHSTCRQNSPPDKIISNGGDGAIELVLYSQKHFNPRRGVLIHYRAAGCATPHSPDDGYLIFRNETMAFYTCCVGFHFPDTGSRTRALQCLGTYWNETLPMVNCQRNNQTLKSGKTAVIQKSEMASDIIAPLLLMIFLFAINGGVLFYIFKARQKQIDTPTDEELGTFTPSSK